MIDICKNHGKVNSTSWRIQDDEDGNTVLYCDKCVKIKYPKHLYSRLHAQKLGWQRDKFAKDIMQPFELKKGEVKKGYQVSEDFIKAYKDDPETLALNYKVEELKGTGVSKKVGEKVEAIQKKTQQSTVKKKN